MWRGMFASSAVQSRLTIVFTFAGIGEYDIIHNKRQHTAISVAQAEAISNW